jgi:hypothetical protein
MKWPSFSIRGLIIVIAILGVALAALRSPSLLVANAVFSLALGSLLVATVNVVISGWEAGRAYWLGFFCAGGVYFAVCFIPGLRESICPRLVTEAVLDFAYPFIAPSEPPAVPPTMATNAGSGTGPMNTTVAMNMMVQGRMIVSSPGGGTGWVQTMAPASGAEASESRWSLWTEPDRSTAVGYQIGTIALVSSEPFRTIGHSMFVLLLGMLGGAYARRRYTAWSAREQAHEPSAR